MKIQQWQRLRHSAEKLDIYLAKAITGSILGEDTGRIQFNYIENIHSHMTDEEKLETQDVLLNMLTNDNLELKENPTGIITPGTLVLAHCSNMSIVFPHELFIVVTITEEGLPQERIHIASLSKLETGLSNSSIMQARRITSVRDNNAIEIKDLGCEYAAQRNELTPVKIIVTDRIDETYSITGKGGKLIGTFCSKPETKIDIKRHDFLCSNGSYYKITPFSDITRIPGMLNLHDAIIYNKGNRSALIHNRLKYLRNIRTAAYGQTIGQMIHKISSLKQEIQALNNNDIVQNNLAKFIDFLTSELPSYITPNGGSAFEPYVHLILRSRLDTRNSAHAAIMPNNAICALMIPFHYIPSRYIATDEKDYRIPSCLKHRLDRKVYLGLHVLELTEYKIVIYVTALFTRRNISTYNYTPFIHYHSMGSGTCWGEFTPRCSLDMRNMGAVFESMRHLFTAAVTTLDTINGMSPGVTHPHNLPKISTIQTICQNANEVTGIPTRLSRESFSRLTHTTTNEVTLADAADIARTVPRTMVTLTDTITLDGDTNG